MQTIATAIKCDSYEGQPTILEMQDGEMTKAVNAQKSDPGLDMWLKPVGVVRSQLQRPSLAAGTGGLEWQGKAKEAVAERGTVAQLVIDEDFDGILDGIEGFSHLLVAYWAHLVPPQGRSLTKVHPMGMKDLPLTGIFATCSPARPNPISVTAVRLLERRVNVLLVEGLEAVDGSPLIDIKPYVPYYYAASDVEMPEWITTIVSKMERSRRAEAPLAASGEQG